LAGTVTVLTLAPWASIIYIRSYYFCCFVKIAKISKAFLLQVFLPKIHQNKTT
jgi:hypothetical protein